MAANWTTCGVADGAVKALQKGFDRYASMDKSGGGDTMQFRYLRQWLNDSQVMSIRGFHHLTTSDMEEVAGAVCGAKRPIRPEDLNLTFDQLKTFMAKYATMADKKHANDMLKQMCIKMARNNQPAGADEKSSSAAVTERLMDINGFPDAHRERFEANRVE